MPLYKMMMKYCYWQIGRQRLRVEEIVIYLKPIDSNKLLTLTPSRQCRQYNHQRQSLLFERSRSSQYIPIWGDPCHGTNQP
jgi:hypothetical protein